MTNLENSLIERLEGSRRRTDQLLRNLLDEAAVHKYLHEQLAALRNRITQNQTTNNIIPEKTAKEASKPVANK